MLIFKKNVKGLFLPLLAIGTIIHLYFTWPFFMTTMQLYGNGDIALWLYFFIIICITGASVIFNFCVKKIISLKLWLACLLTIFNINLLSIFSTSYPDGFSLFNQIAFIFLLIAVINLLSIFMLVFLNVILSKFKVKISTLKKYLFIITAWLLIMPATLILIRLKKGY